MPGPISEEIMGPFLREGHESGWTAEVIQQRITELHGQRISIWTIRQHQKQYGITKQKPYSLPELAPALRNYHDESLTQQRMFLDLSNQQGLEISKSTLFRHLCTLGLTQRKDDVDNGKISIEEAVNKVSLLQVRFGKRLCLKGMKKNLVTDFGIHLHQ